MKRSAGESDECAPAREGEQILTTDSDSATKIPDAMEGVICEKYEILKLIGCPTREVMQLHDVVVGWVDPLHCIHQLRGGGRVKVSVYSYTEIL